MQKSCGWDGAVDDVRHRDAGDAGRQNAEDAGPLGGCRRGRRPYRCDAVCAKRTPAGFAGDAARAPTRCRRWRGWNQIPRYVASCDRSRCPPPAGACTPHGHPLVPAGHSPHGAGPRQSYQSHRGAADRPLRRAADAHHNRSCCGRARSSACRCQRHRCCAMQRPPDARYADARHLHADWKQRHARCAPAPAQSRHARIGIRHRSQRRRRHPRCHRGHRRHLAGQPAASGRHPLQPPCRHP